MEMANGLGPTFRPLPSTGESPLAKRMQTQLKQLQSLPSPDEIKKEKDRNKIGMLLMRLEMLKAMLKYASPQQLKALAREIKEIAQELAALAKQAGSTSRATDHREGLVQPQVEGTPEPAEAASVAPTQPPSASATGDVELRALLELAKERLQEVMDLLRTRAAELDRESKRDLKEAEEALGELTRGLDATPRGDSFYDSLGQIGSTALGGGVGLVSVDV
ncbi:hypothetical protein [Billgrantia endophytica]|uniref:Uncharacterized protein n=1 Tax=Billgrantia endophytica TaxID=2033802 RepID=A0A2N7U6M1_9GAMM|nr:hypothetical protein [Halomonas endophytica]PMR76069.1 hypothetical protein C1H69_06730 [Halomonas endophytica]